MNLGMSRMSLAVLAEFIVVTVCNKVLILQILVKSSPKSIPKKNPSTPGQALVRTGNNCVLLGSVESSFQLVSLAVCLMLIFVS